MPYATGIANNATALRDAVVAAATSNGWAWDAANNMLYKGNIYGKLTIDGLNLLVQAALGYSGGTLTNPAPKIVGITDRLRASGNTLLNYPLTYHIFSHTNPDDIIVAANYSTYWWQWLALGQGTNYGVAGNCVWQWGTTTSDIDTSSGVSIHVNGHTENNAPRNTSGAPFWPARIAGITRNSSIYLNLDGYEWWSNQTNIASGFPDKLLVTWLAAPLLMTQPNIMNGESALARMHVMAPRPSGFWSLVAELPHLRMTRNDYFSDGQIMTYGANKWFIAPVYRRNLASRNGSGNGDPHHSGTIAMAVLYDGP